MKGRQAVVLLRDIPLEGLDLFIQEIQVRSLTIRALVVFFWRSSVMGLSM
jgi:hypothetical protein